MKTLTLIILWTSLHSHVLGMLKDWRCSTPDGDGLVHFPDLPVDRNQIMDAEVVTHTKAFNIFSVTPDCNGTIIGADFCYALMNETDTEQRQVFQLVKLDQSGDTFIPNPNYTDLIFTALPIDRTKCTQQQNGRTVCCQRNTLNKIMRLDGTFSFGIVAQNYESIDYPLLTFGVSRKDQLVSSHRVDFGRLGFPDDIFSNVYDSYNTIRTASNSPVVSLLIEPDKKSTLPVEEASAAQPDLVTAVWCLAAVTIVESVALPVCITLLIIAIVKWRKLKGTQQLKSRQYKKTPCTEGMLKKTPFTDGMLKKTPSTEGMLPSPVNNQNISYPPPTFYPPIPMRVMYNNSIHSQPNSSYSMEQLPPPEQEPEEVDYDDIDVSI